MTWQQLLSEGRVEAASASRAELDDLRAIVARCLKDSALPLDPDNKFAITYNAARTLALMAAAAADIKIRSSRCGRRSDPALTQWPTT